MTVPHQIRHTVRFAVPPSAIYRALMDSRQHRAFTGAPAKIEPRVGGRFTAWGPHLSGITVELVRVWATADPKQERALKKTRTPESYCPKCPRR